MNSPVPEADGGVVLERAGEMIQQGPNRSKRRRPSASQPGPTPPKRVEAQYVKSNLCRVIRADGAYGGVTPQGAIHMGLFSEHTASPIKSLFELDHELHTATEQAQRSPFQWVREIEVDAIMTREVAIGIRDWLDAQLKQLAEVEPNRNVFATRASGPEVQA